MASLSKPSGMVDFETLTRLLLMLSNSIALALNFAVMEPLFVSTPAWSGQP
jgi:hypothetical protein